MRTTQSSMSDVGTNYRRCEPVGDILGCVGDKWTVMVIGCLSAGPKRYNEISHFIEGISKRMLTLTLKGLEQDGLLSRTLHPGVPPRVDYELTELGRSLLGPLTSLYQWAIANQNAVRECRNSFAERGGRKPGSG